MLSISYLPILPAYAPVTPSSLLMGRHSITRRCELGGNRLHHDIRRDNPGSRECPHCQLPWAPAPIVLADSDDPSSSIQVPTSSRSSSSSQVMIPTGLRRRRDFSLQSHMQEMATNAGRACRSADQMDARDNAAGVRVRVIGILITGSRYGTFFVPKGAYKLGM